jgi:hypothetical protein
MSYFNEIVTNFNYPNIAPFGDLVTINPTPIIQFDFVYGILASMGSGTVTGTGATVDTNLSRLRVQSGTTATTGSALFTSYRPARYRAGEGILARFTCVFQAGVAGNVQEIGMAISTDGYMFGYNGTSFGILHRNSSTGSLVQTWTPQTNWNVDTCITGNALNPSGFNWTPTLGNVMQISYPYLGYGNILFYVQNSITGRFILVHQIKYSNTSVNTELSNPTLNFWCRSANTGANTTNVSMFVGSVGIFIAGMKVYTAGDFGADNIKNTITTETCILNVKNSTSFNGGVNKGLLRLRSVSFGGNLAGANPSGIVVLRIKKGVTIGGTPVYTPISGTTANNGDTITNGNSITSRDIAGTTVTGGTMFFNASANMNQGYQIDMTPYDLFVNPSEIWSFTISSTASASAFVSANWQEDI